MKVTLDQKSNSAYIYLSDNIRPGDVANTYPCDPAEVGGTINLDFDVSGRLIGIEVLDATSKLSDEIINAAEKYD